MERRKSFQTVFTICDPAKTEKKSSTGLQLYLTGLPDLQLFLQQKENRFQNRLIVSQTWLVNTTTYVEHLSRGCHDIYHVLLDWSIHACALPNFSQIIQPVTETLTLLYRGH